LTSGHSDAQLRASEYPDVKKLQKEEASSTDMLGYIRNATDNDKRRSVLAREKLEKWTDEQRTAASLKAPFH